MEASEKELNHSDTSVDKRVVYHEKQQLWRCGLHAVNALLKRPVYTAADFGAIADSIAPESRMPWSHPHRSVFGLGDYDVNVLMCALEKAGLRAEWLSAKVSLASLLESTKRLRGFLVNVPAMNLPSFLQSATTFLTDRRHWVAVPQYSSHFYLVDSKLPPSRFSGSAELIRYLERVRKESGHILYVVEKSELLQSD